jgi:hypothetical protein
MRVACFVLLLTSYAAADTRAVLDANGTAVRLTIQAKVARVAVGKAKPIKLFAGDSVGAVEAGHGRVVVALAIADAKRPFRIATLDGTKVVTPLSLKRPNDRADYPFAVAIAPTSTGFAIFFQEIESDNPNEAHTYLVELDDKGALAGEPREVAIPWALAAAAWNGNGFHLALLYSGEMRGARLSMVSTDAKAAPQGHPDWSSKPTAISDVHLVAREGHITAFYRGGDRLLEADVTQIGQWGQDTRKAVDHGSLKGMAIAITAKGEATKVSQ